MIGSKILLICLIAIISLSEARVPLRNHETEETPTASLDNKPKEDTPVVNPVERTPIDTSIDPVDKPSSPRKPVVILFRQNPTFSLFSNRQNPFSPSFRPSLFDHSHFNNNFHRSSIHDDPAIKLISMLLGDRLRPASVQPESTAESSVNSSSESSEDSSRDVNPFESLFPNLFPIPRFPLDETDKETTDKETSSSNEDKTPANFENKEKKVIKIGEKKFVKTTVVKKVKNDFGQFHSVISSYQPFDENIHDENGNEKIKPEESNDDKVSSVDKKDVESSTPTEEKIDVVPSSSTTSSPSPSEVEKEVESTESPDIKLVTPEDKKPERLISENLSKEQDVSKNEIPDKNVEIKVDQMN